MKKIIACTFFALLTSQIVAQKNIPAPTKKVVSDFSELLSPSLENEVTQKLRAFYDSSSTQVAIVTVPVSWQAPLSIEGYANQLANRWALGTAGHDNGVLLLIVGKKRRASGKRGAH